MHPELMAQALFEKAIRLADGRPILQINVVLGEAAGVSSDRLAALFREFRPGTAAADARLEVQLEPGRAACLACADESTAHSPDEPCPGCGSLRRRMVAGHTLSLAGIRCSGASAPSPSKSVSTLRSAHAPSASEA
jgi:Zn finger protein HypA/HybF involved in hydrogenase expression